MRSELNRLMNQFPYMLASAIVILVILYGFHGVSWSSESGKRFSEQFGLPTEPEPVLEDILSRDEFLKDKYEDFWNEIEEAIAAFIRKIMDWIIKHFPDVELDKGRTAIDLIWIVIKAMLIGSCVLCIAFVLKYAIQFLISRSRKNHAEAVQQQTTPYRNSEQLAGQANAAAEKHDFSTAVIFLFRSVLAWLDEHDLVTYHPGKTNREILRTIRSDTILKGVLSQMIPLFNRVRYGDVLCDEVQYKSFLSLCHNLKEGIAKK